MTHDYKTQGKKNRASGADFERRVRKNLQEKGWIVDKWSSNVEFEKESYNGQFEEAGILKERIISSKLIPCKHKFRGPGIPMAIGTGFPDFFSYRNTTPDLQYNTDFEYEVYFIECKVNGKLDKIEKEKAQWYLKNGYCSKFLIAYRTKEKNRVKVNYKEVLQNE